MDNKINSSMSKELSIAELASMVKGRVVGSLNTEIKIAGTCAVDNYSENKVSLVRNRKYENMLADLQNAVILIPEDFIDLSERYPQNIYIVVEDILNSVMDIQDFFYSSEFVVTEKGISQTAKIDKSAKIGDQVYIGENVYIGANVVIGNAAKIFHNSCIFEDVTIGSGTLIYPGVCIYQGCQIGNDCIIDAGAAIGAVGFRYEQDIERKIVRKMLHAGGVMIGDRVEIGANSAIDRATFEGEATIISDDVKIDNLVHVAHNAKIGARTVIVTLSCIGGSARIGEDVWIGIGAAISNGLSIGNRAKVLLNAVVAYDVPDDEIVSGFYAMPHRQWKQVWQKLKSNKSENGENR